MAKGTSRFPWDILLILAVIIFFVANLFISNRESGSPSGVGRTVAEVKSYSAAVESFREKYNALPGDMSDAGKILEGCTGQNGVNCTPVSAAAGDGIIGRFDLSKNWKSQSSSQTHIPPTSPDDESVLFWAHLYLAGLIGGVTQEGIENVIPYGTGRTHPEARVGGAFVVGQLDGTPLPKALSPNSSGIKGIVLLLVSDKVLRHEVELNDENQQALTPLRAAQIDRKMDDGRPDTGYVQAYGSPDCFKGDASIFYNETSTKKSCGLIFRIAK